LLLSLCRLPAAEVAARCADVEQRQVTSGSTRNLSVVEGLSGLQAVSSVATRPAAAAMGCFAAVSAQVGHTQRLRPPAATVAVQAEWRPVRCPQAKTATAAAVAPAAVAVVAAVHVEHPAEDAATQSGTEETHETQRQV